MIEAIIIKVLLWFGFMFVFMVIAMILGDPQVEAEEERKRQQIRRWVEEDRRNGYGMFADM
jgi:hypothetical protein